MKTMTLTLIAAALVVSRPARADTAPPSLVAHEWGTFTSVHGSDGEPILWNPFVKSDLPEFVYDRQNPARGPAFNKHAPVFALLSFKNGNRWLHRMETPVIYFHATGALAVDVKVSLPHGLITEWYPAATSFGPVQKIGGFIAASNESHLSWNGLLIQGPNATSLAALPVSDRPNHYFAARDTSANLVQTGRGLTPDQAGEIERFLFYRGAANFSTPLRAAFSTDGVLDLQNSGTAAITALYVYRVRGQHAELHHLAGLDPREGRAVRLEGIPELRERSLVADELAGQLQSSLEAAGLYPDEARAMINTWQDEWFHEQGLRVLYLVPPSWTDQALPLTIAPRPSELVRVMVGRVEVLEPSVEQKMELLLAQARRTGGNAQIPAMLSLVEKRFLDPALTRAAQIQLAAIHRRLEDQWQEPVLSDKLKAASNELFQFVGQLKSRMAAKVEGLEVLAAAHRAGADASFTNPE